VVIIRHSDVHGAEQYVIEPRGEWDEEQCVPGLNLCTLTFDEVPVATCGFTLRARRGTELSPPSDPPFCIPGTDPEDTRS
jgi:hypothetical protein